MTCRRFLGVRWHDIAFWTAATRCRFPRRDMSRRTKARTCPRTPKPHWRGRNLEGGFLPNAATPKRTGRALRNSQFAIRNCQGFFSGFHFGMDDWGNWRGVRWHDIAFLDATCRVEPKRGRVRALQKPLRRNGLVALSAIRNSQFEMVRASFPVFILGWTMGAKIIPCLKLNCGDNFLMSAAEVIEQIKELPAGERARVAQVHHRKRQPDSAP